MTSNPANFTMTLGTARSILATESEGWAPAKIAEARRIVAYWRKRNAKARKRNAKARKG